MIYEERGIPDELSGIATRAWFLETPPPQRYEKILPMPLVHVIVNVSAPYRLFDADGAATQVADAFVSGLQSSYLVIESPPLIRHVGLELTPVGLHAFSPDAASRAAARVQDARAVLTGIDELTQRLGPEVTPTEALDTIVDYAVASRVAEPDPLVEAALTAVHADPEARIGALAATLGVSHRVLLARFRAVTGTTLKSHAQVLRFHRFVDAVHAAGGRPDWAMLAASSGYYDQSDVIRAFRRFSGWTPAEYYRLVAEHGPDAAHFVPLDQVPAPVET